MCKIPCKKCDLFDRALLTNSTQTSFVAAICSVPRIVSL
jgi:hypothetical protein